MKYYTEKEQIKKHRIDLEYCTLLEEEKKLSLDDLNDLIPGYIHINNRKTLGIEYLSNSGLDKFQKSLSEIQEEGRDFIDKITDLKAQHIFNTSLINISLYGNKNKTISFIQRARYNDKSDYLLYYTTSKFYKDGTNLISYSQPLQMLRNDSFLKEVVEERYDFFSKNYHRFQLLTCRAREILLLISYGDSNKTIADKLCIAYHTVKTHRKNICRKLETGRLIDLVRYSQIFLKDE